MQVENKKKKKKEEKKKESHLKDESLILDLQTAHFALGNILEDIFKRFYYCNCFFGLFFIYFCL